MAQDTETFNSDLYDLLKVRGYKPVPLNSQNQRVRASQEADVIEFTFTKDGQDYGKVWISIDDASNIKVYFDEEQQESPNTITPGVDYDDTWTGLLKHLKKWAQRRQLSFELSNKDRLGDDMRQRDYYKMKEKLGESYHPMGKKASYNDAIPNVKIILQHNRALEEGEQRYRNVARIFLENQDGERFLAPTTRPGIARVYARHIAEGGLPNDDRWNHIKSVCEEYNKMAGFVRATRNKEFNESAQLLINEGTNHYNNLRETLHKLTGHRGYHAYFESWTPNLMEDEFSEDISEMFMSSSLDPRIESVMPILSRLKKTVTEMDELDTLAEWADDIINEKLQMESVPNSQPRVVGNGDKTFDATHPETKEKLVVRAFGPQQAKDIAAKEWQLANSAGVLVSSADAPEASADTTPSKDSAINKAAGQLDPKDSKNAEASKIKGIDAGYQLPGDRDAWTNVGRLGAALVGLEEEVDEATTTWSGKGLLKKMRDANKAFKRGAAGWEKGVHDVDSVKAATKSLSPDQKEKALSAKVGKGSPAELQQKLIKREKNKEVDEATGYYSEKHPKHDQMTKDGYEHSIEDILGDKLHRYFKPGVSLTDLYKYDDEEEVKEDLGPEQKRVGQLGPTEKVKNNNIGKLVGANESTEIDPELARIIEMAKFKR